MCSAMWRPFLKVIRTELPEALNILDRFHIAAHLNAAVDNVRRTAVGALKKGAKKEAGKKLKNMRFTLPRRSQNVRGKARVRLQEVIKSKGATARAWLLKERFQHFWTFRSVDWAMSFLDAWITRMMRSRLEPMKKVARMLRSDRELIGNYFCAKKLYNSGVVQGLNLKCNLVKRRAHGMPALPALQVALYHDLGANTGPELTHRCC